MDNDIPFEEWYKEFKAKVVAAGLPPIEEELAILAQLEGLSPQEAFEQYKKELGR